MVQEYWWVEGREEVDRNAYLLFHWVYNSHITMCERRESFNLTTDALFSLFSAERYRFTGSLISFHGTSVTVWKLLCDLGCGDEK